MSVFMPIPTPQGTARAASGGRPGNPCAIFILEYVCDLNRHIAELQSGRHSLRASEWISKVGTALRGPMGKQELLLGTEANREIAYLESLPLDERKDNGQVYTPDHLVKFILELADYSDTSPIETAPFLEPSCGAGAFLRQAVIILASRLRRIGVQIASRGRHRFLDCVRTNIFGVDVDPKACGLARQAVRDTIMSISPGPLPLGFFDSNVVNLNFLEPFEKKCLPPLGTVGFPYIGGNPPYVSTERLTELQKEDLRRRFKTASGRLDLYTFFIEKSLGLLSPGGRLAMVTPDKFFTNDTSKKLREHILDQGSVETVARFSSHKIFKDAATVPCVTVIRRDLKTDRIRLLSCGDQPNKNGRVEILSESTYRDALSHEAWTLKCPALVNLSKRLRASHPLLKDVTLRISAGPATGRDDVFVLPENLARNVEPELLRPAVRGKDISAKGIADPGLRILVPYTYPGGHARLIDLKAFPKARRYLQEHRAELEKRHCVRKWGKEWFGLHDPPAVDLARKRKIVVPDIAEYNQFVVDGGSYFPLHSTYYLIPKPLVNLKFLAIILNSKITEFLVRLLSSSVKDGFSRYQKKNLVGLPVPRASKVEMDTLVSASQSPEAGDVDRLVAALFKLSKADSKAITEYLADAPSGSAR